MDNIYKTNICVHEPYSELTEYEFDLCLLKFGSLVSMLFNKKITQTNLLYLIIENKDFLDILKNISEINDEKILLYNFIHRYPSISKSNAILNKVSQIYNDRKRKKYL
jgi:hypothetical protein